MTDRKWVASRIYNQILLNEEPASDFRKQTTFIPETNEYRFPTPSFRYKSGFNDSSSLDSDEQSVVLRASSADSVMWDLANLDKEKTIFFYVGFHNGVTYFQLDRSKIQKISSSSSSVSLPFEAPS